MRDAECVVFFVFLIFFKPKKPQITSATTLV